MELLICPGYQNHDQLYQQPLILLLVISIGAVYSSS
jgi:hypothetical protein